MSYLSWIFYPIYAIVTLGALLAVLMDHRQPAKTVAWVLVLVFLPVVGIVIYFFSSGRTHGKSVSFPSVHLTNSPNDPCWSLLSRKI